MLYIVKDTCCISSMIHVVYRQRCILLCSCVYRQRYILYIVNDTCCISSIIHVVYRQRYMLYIVNDTCCISSKMHIVMFVCISSIALWSSDLQLPIMLPV